MGLYIKWSSQYLSWKYSRKFKKLFDERDRRLEANRKNIARICKVNYDRLLLAQTPSGKD